MALAQAGCLAYSKRRPDASRVRSWRLFREGRPAVLTAGLPSAFSSSRPLSYEVESGTGGEVNLPRRDKRDRYQRQQRADSLDARQPFL